MPRFSTRRTPAWMLLALFIGCGDQGADSGAPAQIRMSVLDGGRLTIARFPAFPYDGAGSGGLGRVTAHDGGVASVRFTRDELAIPPLDIVGELVRIDIETEELAGIVDFCSGETHFAFDATFRPVLFERAYPTAISVVTDLTTEAAEGAFASYRGQRIGDDGVGRLVGIARVPVTDDAFVNALLTLPTDAVAELPVRLEAIPERPTCG